MNAVSNDYKLMLDKLKQEIAEAKAETSTVTKTSKKAKAWAICSDLIAALLVGGAIGYGFDKITGWYPFGFISFICLGLIAGFKLIYKNNQM